MDKYLFPFENLDVWNMAVDLAETILSLLEELPQNKHMRLFGQMESAAVSVSQNIAEGEVVNTKRNLSNFFTLERDLFSKS